MTSEIESLLDQQTLLQKASRYAPVQVPFEKSGLSEKEVLAVAELVKASVVMDDLFWEQSYPAGSWLREKLKTAKSEADRILYHYLQINRGPYDRLDDLHPFVRAIHQGKEMVAKVKPEGANYYPEDLQKMEFESWLTNHPDQKEAFQSNFTIIRRLGSELAAVPYSEAYGDKLKKAATHLQQAAQLVDNQSLARYLNSRAAAFMSNDYYSSDVDWMDVSESALEVTIGPYEVYEDRLFNYKAAFESFVTVRDREQSEKLKTILAFLPEMEKALPLPEGKTQSARGSDSPLVVADLIYSAGDTRAGVQTVAFNLPNDERVRAQKGSKKVMLKNISRAKFETILLPISKVVLDPTLLPQVSFDAYFNHTLMHEISHGMGPGYIQVGGNKTTVNLALKELYSTIEEAKADILGLTNAVFLVDKKVFPEQLRAQITVTFLAGIFRSARFGSHEAHAKANVLAFNYLQEKGAIRYLESDGRYAADETRMTGAIAALAKELLSLEAAGNYDAAKAFISKYGEIHPTMQKVLDRLAAIPIDIEPRFELEPAQ